MKDQTYLFYDIETSGLNKCFDQILEFAAIRTDLELNEIEQFEIKIKLNPDVIPTAKACITHRIPLQQMLSGVSEFEGISQIHKILNTPGTISLGYNTLEFDDEFLRFSFYRNLLTPYTHQFAANCSRMDLYPICILYYLYKTDILKWPMIANNISLKLEHLNEFNQLSSGSAHRAIDDVKTTLALAKILFQNQAMWKYACEYFDKKQDLQRIQNLANYPASSFPHSQAILVDGKFGKEAQFQCPVLSLGTHQHFKNNTLWLRLDRPELREVTEETVAEKTWVIRKKLGESGFLIPTKEKYLAKLTPSSLEQMQINLSWLMEQPQLLNKIVLYHQHFMFEKIPNLDAYAKLYDDGFPSYEEINLCQQFHQCAPEIKANLISHFTNLNFRELALRIMGKYFHSHLPTMLKEQYEEYLTQIETRPRIDYKGQFGSHKQQVLQEITDLRSNHPLDAEQITILNELEQYLVSKGTTIEGKTYA